MGTKATPGILYSLWRFWEPNFSFLGNVTKKDENFSAKLTQNDIFSKFLVIYL